MARKRFNKKQKTKLKFGIQLLLALLLIYIGLLNMKFLNESEYGLGSYMFSAFCLWVSIQHILSYIWGLPINFGIYIIKKYSKLMPLMFITALCLLPIGLMGLSFCFYLPGNYIPLILLFLVMVGRGIGWFIIRRKIKGGF